MISILFGYRNRDPERLRACLQSLAIQEDGQAFEVIVCDYGSDEPFRSSVKTLLETFGPQFAYYYAPVEGYLWNRSQALNLAAAKATGHLFIFGDIDLIYPPNFITYVSTKIDWNVKYNYRCRYLPEGVTETNYKKLEVGHAHETLSADTGLGLTIISKENYDKIGGYDERFIIWGVEDISFQNKAKTHSIECAWINPKDVVTYHIWHPNITQTFVKKLYPILWGLYEQTSHLPPCRFVTWQYLEDRNFSEKIQPSRVYELGNNSMSALALCQEALEWAPKGTCLSLHAKRVKLNTSKLLTVGNWLLRKIGVGVRLEPMQYVENNFEKDIQYYTGIVYFLLINRKHLEDYFWVENESAYILYLLKK